MKAFFHAIFLIAATFAGATEAQESQKAKAPIVRIGSKSFTENIILGEMLAHLARDAGAEAEHLDELGGTQILFKALQKGDLDMYPEYTGTLTAEILSEEQVRNDEQIRAALAKRGIRMSERLGFNNTYAIGLKESLAESLKIKTISDLGDPRHATLRLGFSEEFMNRSDGWPGLKETYKLPHRPRGMDHNLAYRGLEAGSIDVTDLYSTDAEVKYYNLRLLEDDRGYFPVYHSVILYRADLEQRAPEVVQSIKRLEGKLSNQAMIEMNVRRKLDHVKESRVAADFLQSRLNIQVKLPAGQSQFREIIGSLLRNTQQHLFLVAISLGAAILVALPLGIWSYKWPVLGHFILAVTGVVQTLPSLAVLVMMIPLLGLGARPAIFGLFLYSLLPIVRGTYSGLKEIPASLKESAMVLGLTPQARLWRVELPIASRSILNGIKTAAIINVGTATLGALIGAGGYGQPIMTGLRLDDTSLILQGAVPSAILALLVQWGFDLAEPLLVPRGLRIAAGAKG